MVFIILDLVAETYKIGRGDECDICITLNEVSQKLLLAISKVHFQISKIETSSGRHMELLDLSSNGTFVNGERVGKGRKRVLRNNDEISVALKNQRGRIPNNKNSSQEF